MRGSAWTVPLLAFVLWLLAVVWPALASVQLVATQEPSGVEMRGGGELLLRSSAWGAAVALGAMAVGWLPGRLLGTRLARRGFVPLAVLLLVPICLPAYVIFFAWWQAWPAGSWLYQWAVDNNTVQLVRQGTLFTGFLCWSWPIVAWCVAGSVATTPAQRDELLRIDGAGRWRRVLDMLRCDGGSLALGGLIVFLVTFNNTTSFDLAQIFSFGNELRAIEALGANERDVLTASAPATLMTIIGAMCIWFALILRRSELAHRTSHSRSGTWVFTAVVWLLSVGLPLGLLVRNVRAGSGEPFADQFRQFRLFYSEGLFNTIAIAAVCAAMAMIILAGLTWMWQDRRRWVRIAAHVQGIGWILAAALPGTMRGVALRAGYNRPMIDDLIYTTPAVLVLGHLASFAFLAALLGCWSAMREPVAMRDLRAVDGAERLVGLLRTTWPRLLAAGAAVFAVVFVLSLSEIPVTAAVRPAGFDSITTSILNDMHFQRPQTVMIATGIFLLLALLAACVATGCWLLLARSGSGRTTRSAAMLLLILGAACVIPIGCGGIDTENAPPLPVQFTFGAPGRSLGQFNYPRAVAVDTERGHVFVVDTTARIQRFDTQGSPQLQWQMPEWESGKPTGITVDDNGSLYVADTHYYRVIAFDAQGNERLRFGSFGQNDGEFVYTMGIAIGPKNRIYVSETGGNDRVQVFDSEGQFLFDFGSFGSGREQFNRPQAMAFNADQSELYIVDACNHRIVVTDPQGEVIRLLGEAGRGPGQFSYPYDLTFLPDGSLLVCEFHNNRLQRISPTGQPMQVIGRLGKGEGELQYPWGVANDGAQVYVVDSGNNRVQVMPIP